MSTSPTGAASDTMALLARLTTAIEQAGEEVVAGNKRVGDRLTELEGLRYVWRVVAAGLVSQVEAHDPAYPHLIKILSPWLNWGYPNPDGSYAFAFLHGDHRYRLHGNRGSARLFDVEVWDGDIADLRNARSLGGLRSIAGGRSELDLADDGSFQIELSQDERPGNWIPLPSGIAHLYVRQWFYDYETEAPGQLYLERVGATYPRPPLQAGELEAGFERVIQLVESVFSTLAMAVEQHFAGPPDTVPFPTELIASAGDEGGSIAFRNQVYGRGRFECAADDAVILEVVPPQAEYWMIGLLSPFWESYDWLGRQISINGHQAHIDTDGVFRAVIAHRDPGVPNWLDAAGHHSGLVGGRYNWAEDIPIPKLTTVPLAQLREHLPADTPAISSETRSETLRRRMLSQERRRVAW